MLDKIAYASSKDTISGAEVMSTSGSLAGAEIERLRFSTHNSDSVQGCVKC